ncbi:hypothetical protein [Psychroflexus tropicus]|uniref:hypothetical protein n=1 Tax=Psychroflexus tropicus TaxID=197345 RepID=UPI000382C222|nr:hypothetical protein [Psychroflexus tropicus]
MNTLKKITLVDATKISFLAFILSFLMACESDTETNLETESNLEELIISAEDDAKATEEFSSITEFALDEVASLEASGKNDLEASENLPSCASLVFDDTTNTLIIDFGTDNCVGNDGLVRTGKILITRNGRLIESGSTLDVELENYSVEGLEIEGTKRITNQTESQGMQRFNVKVNNASLTDLEGRVRTWSSDYTVTRIAGADTLRPYDNVYETFGSSSGVNRNGKAFTRTITEPLVKDRRLGCLRNYVAGELQYESEGLTGPVVLNFGDGECDRKATLSFNGITREIFLR